MIHHISIAANQPQHVTLVLAELCQGQSAPFPYHEGSYVVLALDPYGTMIEVHPQGTKLMPSSEDLNAGTKPDQSLSDRAAGSNRNSYPGYSAFHAAVSVSTSEEKIYEIATREGWHAEQVDRHGYFSIIEVWVENQQLLEFLPPGLADQYLAFMEPRSLGQILAAASNSSSLEAMQRESASIQ